LVPGNASFQVLWKDTQVTPAKDLGRLSQYAGAYASATIDKALEVQHILREKDEKIRQLEKSLESEE